MSRNQILQILTPSLTKATIIAAALTLAACGGGSGAGGMVPSQAMQPGQSNNGAPTTVNAGTSASPTPQGSPIPVPTGLISASGTETYAYNGRVEIKQPSPKGYMWVTPGTTVINGPLAVGRYLVVTGTPSTAPYGINATTISVYASAPSSVTLTGTSAATTAYGFTLNVDSGHQAVPVILDGNTKISGGPLQTGQTLSVTGMGSASTTVTATQIAVSQPPQIAPSATPGPIAQTHVMTGSYLGTPYGTTTVSPAQAAPYLTWAQTGISNIASIAAAGIETMTYFDPNRVLATDPLYNSDETTFAHDCSGNRVTTVYKGITQYVMNAESPSFQTLYKNYVKSRIGSAPLNAVFVDNTLPLTAAINLSALPCNYSDSAWLAGEAAVNQAAPVPTIFNGLSGLNGHNPSLDVSIVPQSLGGNYEHCFSTSGSTNPVQLKNDTWLWQAEENTALQVTAQNRIFSCMVRNLNDAAASTDPRMYVLASFLLTYSPQYSMLWEEFATPSGFPVMPESQLVPLNPVVPSPSAISGLLVSGGAYARQYNDCYVHGAFVGPCAVVVNSNRTGNVPFPYTQYQHTLTLSGEGVLDGGTMSTQGPPPPSSLGPTEGVVAF